MHPDGKRRALPEDYMVFEINAGRPVKVDVQYGDELSVDAVTESRCGAFSSWVGRRTGGVLPATGLAVAAAPTAAPQEGQN